MNRLTLVTLFAFATAAVSDVAAAFDLLRPAKIIQTPQGNLLVAEVGTAASAPNSGRISIVDAAGNRRTLVEGLPSAPTNAASTPSGPSGLYLDGQTLYVAIGEGNPTLPGPVPRTEIPNPNPASPIFSSVLALHYSAAVEKNTTGVALDLNDHYALRAGQQVVRRDSRGRKITIELIVDFPDYVPEPLPILGTNVRHSHPYGVVADCNFLYVVDGGFNVVHKAEIDSGMFATLVSFPATPNPTTFGPPMIENVPTSIRWERDQLLVTILSGFPFVAGLSEVQAIDPDTGDNALVIGGLTSAIDVLPITLFDFTIGYLTLEYSQAQLAGAPGRLQLFDRWGDQIAILADDLVTPSSMILNRRSFKVGVASISLGTLQYIPFH